MIQLADVHHARFVHLANSGFKIAATCSHTVNRMPPDKIVLPSLIVVPRQKPLMP